MPSPKPNETPEQREARLVIQRAYEARVKLRDPEGFRRRSVENTRRYQLRNPEKVTASTLAWRAKQDPDKLRAQRRAWRNRDIVKALFKEASARAKTKGIPFDIALTDIPPMGLVCPIFGIPFEIGQGKKLGSPSIDRIDPSKGYVKGNVWIISDRANRVKNDATADEHQMIADAMRRALNAKS